MDQQHHSRSGDSPSKPSTKLTSPPPIVFILVGLAVVGGMHWWKGAPTLPKIDRFAMPSLSPLRSSSGAKVLIKAGMTPAKQAGTSAFAGQNYEYAIAQFQTSLKQERNDPETLIYLNNAKVNNYAISGQQPFKIAVSVPISSNLNIAQEILRGVAQAQDEANSGQLAGGQLEVEIFDDENDGSVARRVANQLVNDSRILAVVGHNASNASLEAAPVYQERGLVMISPTSFVNQLSGFGSYIFRTVASPRFMADPLAEYVVQVAQRSNTVVCYDRNAPDNISFKDEFIASLTAKGGRIVPVDCDVAAPNFNPASVIAEAISSGADNILLTCHVDRLERVIALAQANQGRLGLFGSPTLYTIKTVKLGQSDVNGLVLPALWHTSVNPNHQFTVNARQRWGGNVNWRTATAYDATRAIITALKPGITRSQLQQALRSPTFSSQGAGEIVRFLPSGDRAGKPILLQVQATNSGYDFVPIRPL